MATNVLLGLLVALLAGALGGTLFMPMKRIGGWAWENIWLVYTVFGYSLGPWVIAWATIPGLANVYRDAGADAVVSTALLGLGWGLGVVLFGIGVDLVGLSLTS